jgi:carboxyl-terminal processing protease
MEAVERGASGGSRRGVLLFLLFAVFLSLTVLFRIAFVAPPEQRAAASQDNRFAIVWEAWRALEQNAGGEVSSPQDAALQAIASMAVAAEQDPAIVVQRVQELHQPPPASVPQGLEDVWRAWRVLRDELPDGSEDALAQAAIRGLAGGAGDPALRYLRPTEYEQARDFFGGDSFEGVGARVSDIDGAATIVEVFLGSPAEATGLKPGDRILTVDGQTTQGLTLEEVVDLIRGPQGTHVTLEVQGLDDMAPRTVVVTRETLPGESFHATIFENEIADERIGYIYVGRFHRTTGSQFRESLRVMMDRGIQGLILDMRSNPGGSLQAATEVASQFLRDGVVMYEVSTQDGRKTEWAVIEGGIAADLPVVVLVNGGSASAAEVVAGALQDHERAALYGTRTYGKGSVQTFQELSDGSALYLTIAHWHTPDDHQIQDIGITPDVEIGVTYREIAAGIDRQFIIAYTDLADQVLNS